jgi:general secretion pathway protein G
MPVRNSKGFTLIEVIVVAGIIAVLAGILVPLIFKEIDESKTSRAMADARSISSAMIVFKKDTGNWPVSASCANSSTLTMLHGAGTLPTFNQLGWDSSNPEDIGMFLNSDAYNCWPTTWKGPYMAYVTMDPWGHSYIINAADFLTTNPVWIMSAGPNGIIDTNATVANPQGDDIGIRLK